MVISFEFFIIHIIVKFFINILFCLCKFRLIWNIVQCYTWSWFYLLQMLIHWLNFTVELVFCVFIIIIAFRCHMQLVIRTIVIIKWLCNRDISIYFISHTDRCFICPASSYIGYIISTSADKNHWNIETFHKLHCLPVSSSWEVKMPKLINYF